ncbi:MAG: hypothetical protein OEW26_05710, partial [Nitrospirota bacterium]|nr:hypothetical protein [Nitrospirota bacterium]
DEVDTHLWLACGTALKVTGLNFLLVVYEIHSHFLIVSCLNRGLVCKWPFLPPPISQGLAIFVREDRGLNLG